MDIQEKYLYHLHSFFIYTICILRYVYIAVRYPDSSGHSLDTELNLLPIKGGARLSVLTSYGAQINLTQVPT
jgi:hypothetical protein